MQRKKKILIALLATIVVLVLVGWYLFEHGVPAFVDAPVAVDGKTESFPVYKPGFIMDPNPIFKPSTDGWIYVKANPQIFIIMIPENYTHVVVEAKNVTGQIDVYRFCGWNEDPQAYAGTLDDRFTRIEFNGCRTVGQVHFAATLHGKRYAFTPPGSLRIDVFGEGWIRIKANP
jgi:hypothetical protein